ncbi:unnamed protein product, partial [marine sediment metagenome]
FEEIKKLIECLGLNVDVNEYIIGLKKKKEDILSTVNFKEKVNYHKALDIKPDLVINLQQFVPKLSLDLNDPDAFQKIPKANDVNQEEVEKISNYILDKLREKNLWLDLKNTIKVNSLNIK